MYLADFGPQHSLCDRPSSRSSGWPGRSSGRPSRRSSGCPCYCADSAIRAGTNRHGRHLERTARRCANHSGGPSSSRTTAVGIAFASHCCCCSCTLHDCHARFCAHTTACAADKALVYPTLGVCTTREASPTWFAYQSLPEPDCHAVFVGGHEVPGRQRA